MQACGALQFDALVCSADVPAILIIQSNISDPPEIELETNKVHSGINKEAHLTCRVQGNPEPMVRSTESSFRKGHLPSKNYITVL